MARLSQEKINEIRQSVDIVDVIGEYLPLEKKGRNYIALCPFHDDKHPSMSVSPDKQIFMCFVCGTGGNVFTFLQKYKKTRISFRVCLILLRLILRIAFKDVFLTL